MNNWWSDEPEYCSIFDEPEHAIAKLYRAEHKQELMRLAVIDNLLKTLTHADTRANLFTFAERRQWGLRVNARRSITEEDGS